ncbi:MAG: PAS domain-containing sensor histidine kinase [Tunicatimonas sp.]
MSHSEPSKYFKEGDPESLQKFQLNKLKEQAESDYSNIKGLFYLIPVPACITNENREFEEVNEAYCQLYGFEREDMVGKSFLMVLPDAAKDELAGRHDDFFSYKHEFSGQWSVQRQDGVERQVLANAAYIPAPGSGHPLKLTFVVDITDVASARENLRLTNDLLGGKLAAQEIAQNLMVHDLRNPINNILSISEMLDKRTLTEDDKRWIKLISHLAQRLERQVRSSSDFAKMEAGQYTLQEECFDLLTLIRQVLRAASGDAARKSIHTEVSYRNEVSEGEGTSVNVRADQFYIEQMITNLVVNALEASAREAALKIEVSKDDDSIKITLSNQGVVPTEIRNNLFEKNVTKGKEEGQGLGSYIARLIAQQHGGDLTFSTSDENQRTTFTITLPDRAC